MHQRSGYSELGMNPVTWATIDAWARRTGQDPRREEIDALFALDAVMRSPRKEATSALKAAT